MSLFVQFLTLTVMIVCGAMIGMVYDTYETLQKRFAIKGWLVALCDFLFWLSSTFFVFGTLLRINDGIVIMYIFIALLAGYGLYVWLFQSLYKRFFYWLVQVISTVCLFLVRLFTLFIVRPMVMVYRSVLWFIGLLFTLFSYLFNLFLKPVKILSKFFYKKLAGVWQKVKNLFSRNKKDE